MVACQQLDSLVVSPHNPKTRGEKLRPWVFYGTIEFVNTYSKRDINASIKNELRHTWLTVTYHSGADWSMKSYYLFSWFLCKSLISAIMFISFRMLHIHQIQDWNYHSSYFWDKLFQWVNIKSKVPKFAKIKGFSRGQSTFSHQQKGDYC